MDGKWAKWEMGSVRVNRLVREGRSWLECMGLSVDLGCFGTLDLLCYDSVYYIYSFK